MDGTSSYTLAEIFIGVIGIALTLAFGAWAAVVKHAAEQMAKQVETLVDELKKLREEIHKDRLHYELRFARLEFAAGLHPTGGHANEQSESE